ncbi:hypothetical protein [Flavobacterium sp. ZT3R25]|uniref:hypothetical protein n=1 Tax=Flavobacterium TaxID=237 RepID=UPI003A8A69F2
MARILDNEKAETFGSLDCGMSIFTVGGGTGIVGALVIAFGSFSWTDAAIAVFAKLSTLAFELSTIE